MIERQELINNIKKEEGKVKEGDRHVVYFDHLGNPTIGYGRLVSSPGGLTDEEADYLLNNDIDRTIADLDRNIPWWEDESPARKTALIHMAFQMGINGLLGFRKMISAMKIGHYDRAYTEALDSRWAKQTPERAMRIAKMIRGG